MRACLVRSSPKVVVLGAFAAAVLACTSPQGGTDVGNGATVDLNLTAFSGDPSAKPASITLGSGTVIDEFYVVIERVRLQSGSACEDGSDGPVNVQGPVVADLVQGGLLGGAARFQVDPGAFCSLRVDFHRIEGTVPDGAPADLQGLSARMRGSRGDGTPFTVELSTGERLELEARDGSFELDVGEHPLFLAYALEPLVAALDLDSLPASPIVINSQTDPLRADAFEDVVFEGARLFADADGDGSLGAFEHEDGDELAH